MSPEAERLREEIEMVIDRTGAIELLPNLVIQLSQAIVTELGITEEMNYALFRAWSDADVVGDQVELKKARHVISALLEVANS